MNFEKTEGKVLRKLSAFTQARLENPVLQSELRLKVPSLRVVTVFCLLPTVLPSENFVCCTPQFACCVRTSRPWINSALPVKNEQIKAVQLRWELRNKFNIWPQLEADVGRRRSRVSPLRWGWAGLQAERQPALFPSRGEGLLHTARKRSWHSGTDRAVVPCG